ncbi:MAG: dihydrodipicolinate synthase family protein [Gammaproteobacteria bacterium]|nr:dihydrodipicolinate synthase family protein [Gammaproteobacteria bacterium]
MTLRGLITPILTPFNNDLSIAMDLYVSHAKRMFAEGCVGIAPFGTTGEALSVGIDERIAAVRGLIDGGIDPARVVPGTGLSNVADTARLSRACMDMGCAGVMTLPPFYFKTVTEDALYRYFEQLIGAIGPDVRIYLYHIPPIAIVGIPPALAARLHTDFPAQVVGIKDSSGDWANTRDLLTIEGMAVYPGSELPLLDALAHGAPGCVSATANINAKAIAGVITLYDQGDTAAAATLHEEVRRFRLMVQDYGPIPAQKSLLALATRDKRWANVRPPLTAMSDEAGRELAAVLKREFDFAVSVSGG